MLRIQGYQKHSKSAKALGQTLGVLLATPQQVRKHGDFDKIINWGSTDEQFTGHYINSPARVADACNKLTSMEVLALAGVPTPDFTTDRALATTWWEGGKTVVCRTLLRASKGRGMVLANRENGVPMVHAPLYTLYVKKASEYRIHVVRDKMIDFAQKKKRRVLPNEKVNYQVRNYANGWVFCRDGVVVPDCVRDSAISSVGALGLDFGGVDVGFNEHEGTATVYEVNTAPGIEGTTLGRYREALTEIIPELRGRAYARRRGE